MCAKKVSACLPEKLPFKNTKQFPTVKTSSVTSIVSEVFHLLGEENQLLREMLSLCEDR